MNKVSPPLMIVWVLLLLCHCVFAAQESIPTLQMSSERMVHLEKNIERAVVCHLYWQKGKSVDQIRKLMSESSSTPYELCRGEGDDLLVFLSGYQWKVDLTPVGGDYFGFYVDDFKADARGDAVESKRSFMEAMAREPQITNGVLTLHPEALTVLAFDKPGEQRHKIFTNLVATNLLNSRWLKKDVAAGKVHGSVVVHIGGFNNQSPWIYYYVEGMPYVGTMLVDPGSGEFIHDDFLFVEEGNEAVERKNMVRSIKENGEKLTLNLPEKQK